MVLKRFNYLVDNLHWLSPSALTLSDLFRVATTFSDEIIDVEHDGQGGFAAKVFSFQGKALMLVARELIIIFRRKSESSL